VVKVKTKNALKFRSLEIVIGAVWVVMVCSGCASSEKTALTAKAPAAERAETATGSNLPRKANKPTKVIVVDPDAIQGAVRGATRGGGGTGP
jgi:hypothetical protein